MIGSGVHTLKAAAYAKDGRLSEIFVSRLDPDVSVEDVKAHVKTTFNIDADVECVRSTQYHTSFRVSAKTVNPRLLLDTRSWPEGAFVKRWFPRRTPAGNHTSFYEVSDNTMGNIPMPGLSDNNPKILVDESAETFFSANDGSHIAYPISDRTMGSISYNFQSPASLIHGSDSDSDFNARSNVVKTPTDLFLAPRTRKFRKLKRKSDDNLRSPIITRSKSRSNLNMPQSSIGHKSN